MHVNKRSLSMIVVAVSLLAGCGTGTSKSSAPSSSPNNKTAASAEPIKLSTDPVKLKIAININWLGKDEFQKYFADPVAKKYPNISFEVYDQGTKEGNLDTLLAGGIVPDIVAQSNLLPSRFIGRGLEFDISPLIKKFNFDLSRVPSVYVDAVKTASGSDTLTGLPWSANGSVLIYNKDLFDKFGVAYPKDGMTWEDYHDLAVKLTRYDGGAQYRGGEPDQPKIAGYVLGLQMVDPKTSKASVNNDSWKRVFTMLKSFYDIPGNSPPAYSFNAMNQFTKDKTLAMYETNNVLLSLANVPDLNWDLAEFPAFKEMPNIALPPDAWIIHITKQSTHKDEAFAALQTILSDEVQTDMAKNARIPVVNVPNLPQVFGQNVAALKGKHVEALFKSKPAGPKSLTKYEGDAESIINTAMQDVAKGNKDIDTALRDADDAINQKIAATK